MVVRWCYLLLSWFSLPWQSQTHKGLHLPMSQIRFRGRKKTFSKTACFHFEYKPLKRPVEQMYSIETCKSQCFALNFWHFLLFFFFQSIPPLAYIQRPRYSDVGWCLPSLLCYLCQQGPWDDLTMLDDSDDKEFLLQMLPSCLLTQITDILIPHKTLISINLELTLAAICQGQTVGISPEWQSLESSSSCSTVHMPWEVMFSCFSHCFLLWHVSICIDIPLEKVSRVIPDNVLNIGTHLHYSQWATAHRDLPELPC